MDNIRYIDINCDVGEGVGNEDELLPLISSCSIACGGHAGNLSTMRKVVRLALTHHVLIGAHPSYPDTANFGRLSMAITKVDLIKTIQKQLSDLQTVLTAENAKLSHIKAHGALYNDIARNEELATVFLEAIHAYRDLVVLYVPFDSVIEKSAISKGYKVKREAFVDRNYMRDLSLVSRKQPNALLTKPDAVLAHLLRLVNEQKVRTIENSDIKCIAETYCLHGDTPDALGILMYLRENLTKPQFNIRIAK